MILYPAIDLMGGRCVRLSQGKRSECTVYSDNPAEMAEKWAAMGSKWLHVIDLDGAIDGVCFSNRDAIIEIVNAVKIPVQVGGGIRTADNVRRYLGDGVARVIVGTSALQSRDFAREVFSEFGEKAAVSIDSADGRVAVKGWTGYTGLETVAAARMMRDDGAKVIILTDIRRDGMLTEPNYEMMLDVADAVDVPVIAAGGVSSVKHVERLASLNHPNISGAIIGKALYTGKFDLADAIKKFPQ